MICRCVTAVGAIVKIYISQGSVATRLRCGGIFNGSFIANFLQIVAVKEFLKSVNIWRRHELEYGVSLFLTHGVQMNTSYAYTSFQTFSLQRMTLNRHLRSQRVYMNR